MNPDTPHTASSPRRPGSSLRALVIEHEQATPGGLVLSWLEARSIEVDVLRIYEDTREVDPNAYDLVVSLGSEFAAFDESVPWLGRERALLTGATGADVPVLGVCFGGQLLASVLGGAAFRAQTSEVGWFQVRTTRPELVGVGPWFQWHFDSFTPPPGATLIAESDAGPQAYVSGRNLGVQFHPEVTNEIMDDWVATFRHELDAVGVDPDALIEETRRNTASNHDASMRLLDGFLENVAGLVGRDQAMIDVRDSSVLHRYLDIDYPEILEARGVRLTDVDGHDVIDACSGGAMVTSLGHGDERIVNAAHEQADRISYLYNHHFTNDAQERLAARLIEVAAPEMARVRFVSGGSEANETALRLVRAYHVERGDTDRWRIISPAQAYHGATMGTLGLTGRPHLQAPFEGYLANQLHIAPSTWRQDPSGQAALDELDEILERVGAGSVAAFLCEPISGAALPAYSPPDRFWQGLAERRETHGFLICFDEVVTGMGRTGTWFAYQRLPIEPDIVTLGKGLGAGYAPIAAVLCRAGVHDAIAAGSREFEHGHTWDGAPLPCAVGLAVMDIIVDDALIERVRDRGPRFRDELAAALADLGIVREVRGRGYLFGVDLVDPRDGVSILPDDIHAADLVDDIAYAHGVLVTSTHPNADRFAGDQTLLAPAFTSTDAELAEMIERFTTALRVVDARVRAALA